MDKLIYEEAAEIKTGISGWVCKNCSRFWGNDEHMARWCCAKDLPCECGKRVEKSWAKCQECRSKSENEKWSKLERVEWDGSAPVVTYHDDKYFFDSDSLRDYCMDTLIHPKDLRLVLCEENSAPEFSMYEFLTDCLPEEEDFAQYDSTEVEKMVNDWIAKHSPFSWTGSNKAITGESILKGLGWGEEEEKEFQESDR